VNGIRNITGGVDIISDDMRLLANDDEDEDENAEVSKAAPSVDAQNSAKHAGDVNGQEVDEGGRQSTLPVTEPYTDTGMESCRTCNSYSRLADYLVGFSVYQQG
jgi:hypothetical protein